MPESLFSGMIYLILKGGDRQEIRQWRLITLLTTAYKILAKMISSRIRPLLPNLIHDTQTSFVQDRSILDNIFTFSEATEWAQHSSQHLAIVLLDFEKAYDRVDWSFLEGTLSWFGFPDEWIRGISSLYRSGYHWWQDGRGFHP